MGILPERTLRKSPIHSLKVRPVPPMASETTQRAVTSRYTARPAATQTAAQIGTEEAREAARVCALNVLAQIEAAAGLDRVEAIAQLIGWVRCADDFEEHPEVINAASDLIAQVLGERGKHTRAALGTNSLPRGVTVEIAATVLVKT